MTAITIKFQKTDQYKNLIFIAKSEMPDDQETFKRLTNFHNKWKDEITPSYPFMQHPYTPHLDVSQTQSFNLRKGLYTH